MGIVPVFPGSRRGQEFGEIPRRFSLDAAYSEAERKIYETRIDPRKFKSPYSDTPDDLREAARLEAAYAREDSPKERESYKLATIVEAVVHDQINRSQWFGPKAKSIKTSGYDDYINGVDSIIEFQERSAGAYSHLALAMDVTYGKDLEKKFARIQKEIQTGSLSEIKYFKSSDGNYEGRLGMVPRVVVALDRDDSEGLARAWYGNNPALKNDPIRYQILLEIRQQLETFVRYAARLGQSKTIDRCNLALSQVANILQSIQHKPDADDKYKVSIVGQRISAGLSSFV